MTGDNIQPRRKWKALASAQLCLSVPDCTIVPLLEVLKDISLFAPTNPKLRKTNRMGLLEFSILLGKMIWGSWGLVQTETPMYSSVKILVVDANGEKFCGIFRLPRLLSRSPVRGTPLLHSHVSHFFQLMTEPKKRRWKFMGIRVKPVWAAWDIGHVSCEVGGCWLSEAVSRVAVSRQLTFKTFCQQSIHRGLPCGCHLWSNKLLFWDSLGFSPLQIRDWCLFGDTMLMGSSDLAISLKGTFRIFWAICQVKIPSTYLAGDITHLQSMVAFSFFVCLSFVSDLGVAYAFGSNERGQLGTGDLLDVNFS